MAMMRLLAFDLPPSGYGCCCYYHPRWYYYYHCCYCWWLKEEEREERNRNRVAFLIVPVVGRNQDWGEWDVFCLHEDKHPREKGGGIEQDKNGIHRNSFININTFNLILHWLIKYARTIVADLLLPRTPILILI